MDIRSLTCVSTSVSVSSVTVGEDEITVSGSDVGMAVGIGVDVFCQATPIAQAVNKRPVDRTNMPHAWRIPEPVVNIIMPSSTTRVFARLLQPPNGLRSLAKQSRREKHGKGRAWTWLEM